MVVGPSSAAWSGTNGHQAAEPVVFDTIAGAIEAGVRYLSLYTFLH